MCRRPGRCRRARFLPASRSLPTAGSPSVEGSYQFVVRAQNGGQSATATYTLVVRQPVVVKSQFGSLKPPRAEVRIRLLTAATATGGTGTYAWSISSGALPV